MSQPKISGDERIHILENALFESNESYEKSKTISSPNWLQLITPGVLHSSANTVFRSIVSDLEIDRQIDEVTRLYQSMGVAFRWLVTPLTEPKSTSQKLLDRGFNLLYEAEALMIDVKSAMFKVPSNIEVREIKLPDLELYVDTVVAAWGGPDEQKTEVREFVSIALRKEPNFHAFVAFVDGTPAGTSLLLSLSGGGYLAAGGVKAEFRGRGVYRAMIAARAKLAEQLGHQVLMIHAKKATSAPICKANGFEWVYDYQVYEFKH